MSSKNLRGKIAEFLQFKPANSTVSFNVHEREAKSGYHQLRIIYQGEEGDEIPAFLLLPEGKGPFAAVVVHHQHHGQRHWGKSEVAGLVGDPLNAFGPALAKQGLIVLAPDSICFEDRRQNRTGTEPDEMWDVAQHYNELCYRLLQGDTLMRKVLSDSAQAVSLLSHHPLVENGRIGMIGHSYGGSTTLFHAALDERIRFAGASGASCSFAQRINDQTGIELSQVIPNFAVHFDFPDLVTCIAPRPLLLISGAEDKYAKDADRVTALAQAQCRQWNIPTAIEQKRYEGGHTITPDRFADMIEWVVTISQNQSMRSA